jgi:hypothetical protein
MKLGEAGLGWWKWAWRTPQSTMWDESSAPLVARRAQLEDELLVARRDKDGNPLPPPGSLLKAVLDLDDRLGLSPKALLQLRWRIEDIDAGEQGSDGGDLIVLPGGG